ncbi:MAG: tail fiber domain-containing protein [Candidatus Omnitrophica bacterium]|nr:tail fiber domain-containing protein [Candidatus Omnitrophota bacterium]
MKSAARGRDVLMYKRNVSGNMVLSLVVGLILSFLYVVCFADETLTITTYYPSPVGSYQDLYVANKLGIGTNNPYYTLHLSNLNPFIAFESTGIYKSMLLMGAVTSNNRKEAQIQYSDDFRIYQRSFFDDPVPAAELVMIFTKDCNVGIGVTAPGTKLSVKGTAQFTGWSTPTSGTGLEMGYSPDTSTAYIMAYSRDESAYKSIGFGTGSATQLYLKSNGNVGIGMTNPTYKLQLSTDSAAKPSTSAWTIVSDRRVKKDIHPYTNGLKVIKQINPVWFKYNGKGGFLADNQEHIGVIAQEVVKVAPYTVNTFRAKLNPTDKKETELLNFNSHALTFDLINAVKELDSNITKLGQENHGLKRELENLKTRLSRLETSVK